MRDSLKVETEPVGYLGLPSFADTVEAHKGMVFSIAWHFLRDRALAEELAQDVFLQLHRCWSQMESEPHILHWLRRTASHRCIDEIRRGRKRHEVSLDETGELTTLEKLQDPLLSAYLERMVASLPEKQRLLIILHYQEEMAPEEISQTLGMKVNTVKTQLHRAVELLRSKSLGKLRAMQGREKTNEHV